MPPQTVRLTNHTSGKLIHLIIIFICVLTVLYSKKPAAAWAALVAGTLLLYLVGGPHLFTFSLLGFTWAFAKIGCLSAEH